MARNNETVVREAEPTLDRFKYEVADELGLLAKVRSVGWGNMTTREAGAVGGHMVRRLIRAAEDSLAAQDAAPTAQGGLGAGPRRQQPMEGLGAPGGPG